eukprot:COSAG03_NODE_3843_length_1801_cov_3.619271_2_plen_122_part_00
MNGATPPPEMTYGWVTSAEMISGAASIHPSRSPAPNIFENDDSDTTTPPTGSPSPARGAGPRDPSPSLAIGAEDEYTSSAAVAVPSRRNAESNAHIRAGLALPLMLLHGQSKKWYTSSATM